VVTKVREKSAVSKEEVHKYEMQRFNFKNISELEVWKQYKFQISHCRVRVGKHLSDMFPIRNGYKQEDDLAPLLYNFPLQYVIMWVQVNQDGLILQGGSNMTGTDLYVNKPHCAAAVRP